MEERPRTLQAEVAAVIAGEMPGAVVEANNLDLLRKLPDGVIDLCYADPPFATGDRQRLESIRTGDGERTRRGFGGRDYHYEVVSDLSYADDLPLEAHLAALRERLVEVHRVLAPHGSLYLHVDWRTTHHVRLLLDGVFGPERFLNEIVWAYDYGGRARDRWPRKHDTILWYAKGDSWLFDREAIDRVPYMAPGLVGPEKAARGKLPTDVWWMTIVPPASAERTGYPTQKPLRLLERIVAASSRPGDLVLDPYAGSGTTGVAAMRLGRRWLLADRSPDAVAIARARIAREAPAAGGDPRAGRQGTPDQDLSTGRRSGHRPMRIEAITLDFGNTLVAVPAGALRTVVGETAAGIAERFGPFDADDVRRAWAEERERQFREDVPQLREVDLAQRVTRILARLRGMPAPPPDRRWDDEAAGRLSDEAEVSWAVERYSALFVERVPADPAVRPLLARLAGRHPIAILSNWPLASTIDRFVDAAGWAPYLRANVVSQREGTIKPHPAIFAAARRALGDPDPGTILHVGDDWAADVVGAKRAGWRAAYLHDRPEDSPLPASARDERVVADLELRRLPDLLEALDELPAGP